MGKKNRKHKKKVKKGSCGLCDDPDEGKMIACDSCDVWYHFACVDVLTITSTDAWNCPSCRKADDQANDQNISQDRDHQDKDEIEDRHRVASQDQHEKQSTPKYTGAIRKDAKRVTREPEMEYAYSESIRSVDPSFASYRTGQTNRIDIELQRIEEEKDLQQRIQQVKYNIERRFLKRKYDILLFRNERGSHRQSTKASVTEKWVEASNITLKDNERREESEFDIDDFYKRLDALNLSSTNIERNQYFSSRLSEYGRKVINPEKQNREFDYYEPKDSFIEKTEDKRTDSKDDEKMKSRQPSIHSLRTDEPRKSKLNLNQEEQPIKSNKDNWNDPVPGRHTLTRAQIASRQVVTRDLPIFTGEPEDWSMFHKRFVNSTDLCGYSDGENLDRLQKCLKGTALDAVKDLLLDAESVPDIIKLLEKLFGRPELIIKRMLNRIRKLPSPKSDNLNSIVSFALDVQNLTKTIERKELHQYLSNPILLQELVDRLPNTYKVDWARYIVMIPDNRITLTTLSDWLQKLMTALIKVTEYVPKDKEKKFDKKANKSNSEQVNVHQEDKKIENSKKSDRNTESEAKCKICNKGCKAVADCEHFKLLEVDQRWKTIFDNKLCRVCLRRHSGFCRIKKDCGVDGCSYRHHTLLHNDQRHKLKSEDNSTSNKDVAIKTDVQASHISFNTEVILRIVPIKIYGNGVTLDTFAFLDDGSTATLIDEKLADELNLVGVKKSLCLIWSAKIHRREKNSRKVDVMISTMDDTSNRLKLKDVKTVECLGIPIQRLNKEELCKKYPYLQDVPFASYENGLPGILIGSNNPRIGIPRKVIDRGDFEPIAAKTKIGWSIHGPINGKDSNVGSLMHHYNVEECKCQHEHDEALHQGMKEYFSVDNFGVKVPDSLMNISKDEEKALRDLKDLTKRTDGRFETGLLWRHENFNLPESYWMAKRRLECIENKKPETIKVIDDTINDYVRKGYARKLTPEEAADHSQRHWYLPVFTVIYPKKPNKQRMVFDAAAKVQGVSLNSMLLKGPDQLVSLISVLRRFREKRFAACGDIREMYHQVKIKTTDQNCQRFLWRNGDKTKEPDVYVMLVMTFGAACSPCAAHFIKNLNATEWAQEYPRAAEAITENHYMDDMMERENSEEDLIQLAKDVKFVHAQAGFEIRNFISNSEKFMRELDSTSELEDKSINPDKEYGIERVLGMWWNVKADSFTFSLKFLSVTREILTGEKLPTKRELLKLLMSIFDPLGLISHFLIHLKILIQDIWRSKLDWDQPIASKEIIESWNKWLEILPAVETIQIPRLYTPKLTTSYHSVEIHTFVDASEKAFGAVSYLRVEDESGVECSLMGSKSRVSPLKYLSIPRKELQSGLLGSRLTNSLISSQTFKVDRRIFWTDSLTLLSWLGSDQRKYHQFVAHRVGEIMDSTNLSEWRWLPSKLNVADDLTKWSKSPIFDTSSRWFNGPSFLRESEDKWPVLKGNNLEETLEEMKVVHTHNEIVVSPLFDSTRFSNWNRMVRAVAYVLRFVKILKAKISKVSVQTSPLTREELVQSRNLIYRQAQFEGFPEEMVILELNKILDVKDRRVIPKSSSLISCSPYLDEFGVLRVRGRIDLASNIPTDTKRPIIMPRKNLITRMLVGCYHRIYHHRNHETVVNEMRQKFYVPKLRVLLKSFVTNDCQLCKNRRAKPEPPEEGNLPAGRMAIGFRPFTHTGIDYFGPFKIIQGRSEIKRWGVIFTCLTIRAIHIEIAYKLDTQSCINCIRNFIIIRGQPREFYSDCGTNLTGTNNELIRALESVDMDKLATEFTNTHCQWNFNPPETKHMGGSWERLVRSIKTCFYDILPERRPSDEMLRCLLLEAVHVVNARPLTFIPLNNANDEALTPNHFILGTSNGQKPPGDFESDGPILYSQWKEIQRLADCFWKRFVVEYLPTLTRKTKWFQPVQPLEIGDVVLVIDAKNSRNIYPKARIIDRVIGSNNQVRRAKVQFQNGSALWRGAAGLARLDVLPKESSAVVPNSQTGGTVAKGTASSLNTALQTDLHE